MSFNERFKAARRHAGLTQQALADAIGISQAAVNQMESGLIGSFKIAHAFAFEKATGVRAEWVATGKGDKFAPGGAGSPEDRAQIERIIKALESLPETHREKIESEIRFLASLQPNP